VPEQLRDDEAEGCEQEGSASLGELPSLLASLPDIHPDVEQLRRSGPMPQLIYEIILPRLNHPGRLVRNQDHPLVPLKEGLDSPSERVESSRKQDHFVRAEAAGWTIILEIEVWREPRRSSPG
jgi:hypothetical protein